MSTGFEIVGPLQPPGFGRLLRGPAGGAEAAIAAAEADPAALPRALNDAGGLLLLRGMDAMGEAPELLVRLSRVFGPEVEDYTRTGMTLSSVHPDVPEILVVANTPTVGRQPPALPDPPRTQDGGLPVQYPHRRGWHTDQSYRRPPPDISLFLAVLPAPRDQGQTLFADGTAAYAALAPAMQARLHGMEGLHAAPGIGRRREAIAAGQVPPEVPPQKRSQRQPVVRIHPGTGRPALYLCEHGQMDWHEGPIVGMQPGPDGDGAALLDGLMAHLTRPEFVYAHEWERGDLIVWDNRCTLHSATWFDAAKHERVMWRTTIRGNPDPAYAGEAPSWLAA